VNSRGGVSVVQLNKTFLAAKREAKSADIRKLISDRRQPRTVHLDRPPGPSSPAIWAVGDGGTWIAQRAAVGRVECYEI